MSPNLSLNALASQVRNFNKEQCIKELLNFPYLPFDFNRAFLNRMSLDKLRYIIIAAYDTVKKYH